VPQCYEYPDPVPAYANLAGQALNFAPRFSGDLGVRFSPDIHGIRITTEVSSYFSSRYDVQQPLGSADPDGLFRKLGDYDRVDGRLSVEPDYGPWGVDVIGKNLTNRVIAVSYNAKQEPRNVALQVRYSF
jgi:iron complex outermembrane receptor protein